MPWRRCAPLPTARHDLCAVTVGDRIFAISGAVDSTLSNVDVYHPASDSWSSAPPIPTGRGWAGAVLLDHTIYVVGGKTILGADGAAGSRPAGGKEPGYITHAAVDALNTHTMEWQTGLPALREARAGPAVVAHRGEIWTIGGVDMSTGTQLQSVEIWDPASRACQFCTGVGAGAESS